MFCPVCMARKTDIKDRDRPLGKKAKIEQKPCPRAPLQKPSNPYPPSSSIAKPLPPFHSLPHQRLQQTYPIALKKLSSLIPFLLFSLIALVNPSLTRPASFAASNPPSPPGKSTLCS
jgi:hypothetical protein